MSHILHSLFHPKILAVVGASDRYATVGRSVFSQLLVDCVATTLVPINPKHKNVGGLKSYENLEDAAKEYDIDTIVLIVAADKVATLVREAIKIGIKQVVVINEMNTTANAVRRHLERAAELAEKSAIRLLAVPASGVAGLFSSVQNVASAYIGQAEGVADCVERYAQERGIEFSRFLTLNPHSGYTISTGDIIDYIAVEDSTTSLLVQVSVLDNPRELVSALVAAARRKPVVVLSTLENKEQETLFLQALERNYVLVAKTLTEFFTAAKLIHTRMLSRGNRLSIISNTPQITELTLNVLSDYQLELAPSKPSARRMIERILSYKPERTNPLYLPMDVSAGVLQSAIEQKLSDENTDVVLLICSGRSQKDNYYMANVASAMQQRSRKPLILVWLGSADTKEVRQLFNKNKNLHFRQPENALHALVQLNLYREKQQQRHQLSSFHDYRYAVAAAESLHKHLRPILPVAVLPASKQAINQLLTALRLERMGRRKFAVEWQLQWHRDNNLGQVLTLSRQGLLKRLLPPVTPELISSSLTSLGIVPDQWQSWLLTTADILTRLPEIHSLELSLAVDEEHFYATDVKLNLQETNDIAPNVLTPYPATEEVLTLKDGSLAFLRPIRLEDASLICQHIENMDSQSRYTRFMVKMETPPATLVARLSKVDYQREYALVLHNADNQILAMANYTADANLDSCEFGISTIEKVQGQGLASLLMDRLVKQAKMQGFRMMRAEMFANNTAMQRLALKFGFTLSKHPSDHEMIEAKLQLT